MVDVLGCLSNFSNGSHGVCESGLLCFGRLEPIERRLGEAPNDTYDQIPDRSGLILDDMDVEDRERRYVS